MTGGLSAGGRLQGINVRQGLVGLKFSLPSTIVHHYLATTILLPFGNVASLRIVSTKAISMPWSTPGSRVLPSSRAEEGATTAP